MLQGIRYQFNCFFLWVGHRNPEEIATCNTLFQLFCLVDWTGNIAQLDWVSDYQTSRLDRFSVRAGGVIYGKT